MTKDRLAPAVCDQAVPWRESSHFDDPMKLPGQILAGARYREGGTQSELSRRTGISSQHLSQMENGHKNINETNAKKMAEILRINWRHLFLRNNQGIML